MILNSFMRHLLVSYATWPLHLQAYRRQVYRCLCVPYEPTDRLHPAPGPKLLGLVRWSCGAERYQQADFRTVQRLIIESYSRAERLHRCQRGRRGPKKCPPP